MISYDFMREAHVDDLLWIEVRWGRRHATCSLVPEAQFSRVDAQGSIFEYKTQHLKAHFRRLDP